MFNTSVLYGLNKAGKFLYFFQQLRIQIISKNEDHKLFKVLSILKSPLAQKNINSSINRHEIKTMSITTDQDKLKH